jgi:hypothetical protein
MARWVRGWDVESDSSDKIYRVSLGDNEEWGCSCPVWKFRRQECKHILKIKSEINWQEGNMVEVVKLKSELIAKYKSQGKSDEWITNNLTAEPKTPTYKLRGEASEMK